MQKLISIGIVLSATILLAHAEEPVLPYIEDKNLTTQELKVTEIKAVTTLADSAYKLLDVKNEFPESLKIIFEANGSANKEIYLNAYETSKGVILSSTTKYKVQVYDLLGEYKGYIRDADTITATMLQISPFLLVQDYNPPTTPDDLFLEQLGQPTEFNTNQVETLPELGVVLPKHSVDDIMFAIQNLDLGGQMPTPKLIETKPTPQPAPIEKSPEDKVLNTSMLTPYREYKIKKTDIELAPVTKPETVIAALPVTSEISKRKIKIANLTAETLRVNISKDDIYIKEQGWTINGDDYSPQYLKIDNQVVEIDSATNIFITDKSNTTVKKFSSDFNIDERGNYIFVIESLK